MAADTSGGRVVIEMPLMSPGTRYASLAGPFVIIVRSVDALRNWRVVSVEPRNRWAFRLDLRGSSSLGEERIIAFCLKDIFRVAKETHVIP